MQILSALGALKAPCVGTYFGADAVHPLSLALSEVSAAEPALLATIPGLVCWACTAGQPQEQQGQRWGLLKPFLRFALRSGKPA